MTRVLDHQRYNTVGNVVITSLLSSAGGRPSIAAMLRQNSVESQLLEAHLTTDETSNADLLSQLLGVEPLISEQEYA